MQRFGNQPGEGTRSGVTGAILLAHPGLLDPNFRKAVVYIASHDEEGTLGFVLNKPLGKTVAEIIPGQAVLGEVGAMPVYAGGPVGHNQLIICSFHREQKDGSIICSHNLSASDVDLLADDDSAILRAFVGYSGWNAGQLEEELTHESWIVKPPMADILHPNPDSSLWSAILERMGAWGKFQAGAPDDLSLN